MGTLERPGVAGRIGETRPSGLRPPALWFLEESRDWAAGRSWMVRAPLVLYLAYAVVRYIADEHYSSIFAALSLGLHELGHLIFGFLPFFFVALAGSAVEVIVPLIGMVMFLRQPDYFGVGVLGAWLSFNLFGIARYIADSRDQVGMYVTVGGGDAQHDWEYILDSLGLLQLDKAIGGVVWLLAAVVGLASLAYCTWLLIEMGRRKA
ncbi:MAG TPA: hypothetical protein VFV54_10085 [Thermoanaerobaculia bacterium]|nr:hypothetical protein [Thermoanaerobaculia bacterium]